MIYRKKSIVGIAIAAMVVVCLSACSKTKEQEVVQVDSVAADEEFYRVTMGGGYADKADQYLYVTDLNYVYEMDLDTYEVLTVKAMSNARYLNIVENSLYYAFGWNEGVSRYDFDTEQTELVYDATYLADVYATEQYTYGLIGRDGVFVRINNETGGYEELVDDKVMMYAKYGELLYYILDVDETTTELWYLNENTGETGQIELDIMPIALAVYQDKIYMSSQDLPWLFYEYDLETNELRQIEEIQMTYNFCCNDNWLYYIDDSEDGRVLTRYSLETEEKQIIQENVVAFSLFSDGTIVLQLYEEGYTFVNYYLEEQADGTWKWTRVLPVEAQTAEASEADTE